MTELIRHWQDKFRNAFRGIQFGIVGQSSFHLHFLAVALVVLLAVGLRCDVVQWTILGLCIALVMSLELMNSSIEYLARGLCRELNADVGKSLDIASAAVLVASFISLMIGLSIFLIQAQKLFFNR